jgi:hypothetical protein
MTAESMRRAILSLAIATLGATCSKSASVQTLDSLSLRQGTYSSLLFTGEPVRTPGSNLPVQYRFTESGATPPGMRFESYPCNKPDRKVCPQLARANGVYLDGTPEQAGSYTFVITALDVVARTKASQQFTVVVKPPDPHH